MSSPGLELEPAPGTSQDRLSTSPSAASCPPDPGQALVVASFYKFADLPDYAELRQPIRELCEKNLISGGIILAPEGINGSICGTRDAVEAVFAWLRSDSRLATLTYREQPAGPEEEELHGQLGGQSQNSPLGPGLDAPFRWDHVRVKLKKEVVSMGVEGVDPHKQVGKYVSPREWNKLLTDPETIVVDVRNLYETRIGMFKGAVDPATNSFRQFPAWVDDHLMPSGTTPATPHRHLAAQEVKSGNKPNEAVDQCAEPHMVSGTAEERSSGKCSDQSGVKSDSWHSTDSKFSTGNHHFQAVSETRPGETLPGSANESAAIWDLSEGVWKEEKVANPPKPSSQVGGPREVQGSGLPEDGPSRTGSAASSPGAKLVPKRVAMYCTGGIRCEKATSFMLAKGFQEVYHLEGGILRYLEEVPPSESLWEGECFVFDKRVAVGPGLKAGSYRLCYGCKQPVSDEDMQSPLWEEGISCPYCYPTRTEEEKLRARARQAQFEMWGVVGGPDKGRRPKSPERPLGRERKAREGGEGR